MSTAVLTFRDAYKSFKTVQKHIFAVRMATKPHHSTTLEHPTLKCRRKPKHRGVFAPNLRHASRGKSRKSQKMKKNRIFRNARFS